MGCRGCVPCATSVRSTVSMTRWHPSRVFRQERVFLSCCRPLAGWPRCMGHAENIASARTQFIGDHARCSGQNRPSKVHALRAVLARKLSAVSNSALFKAFTVMRLRKARRGIGLVGVPCTRHRSGYHPISGCPLASQCVCHARDRPKVSREPRHAGQAHLQNAGQMEI